MAKATAGAAMVEKLVASKPPSGLAAKIGSKVTGAEVGGLLGFLAGKVLGQFDPFHEPHGRLLLVAPNIVHVERELDVLVLATGFETSTSPDVYRKRPVTGRDGFDLADEDLDQREGVDAKIVERAMA